MSQHVMENIYYYHFQTVGHTVAIHSFEWLISGLHMFSSQAVYGKISLLTFISSFSFWSETTSP